MMFVLQFVFFTALWACYYLNFGQAEQGVGQSCFKTEDCGLWHFVCEDDICKCDDEHIPDPDNKWCDVDIECACGYHDTCYDRNASCVGVAIPKYGSCQCNEGFTLHKQKRVCSVVIRNNCSISDECIEGTCVKGKCTCNNPLEPNTNGTKCLPGLHKDCKAFDECAKDNAVCNNATALCECDKDHKETEREKEIFCLTKLDVACQNKTECADIGAECVAKNVTENGEEEKKFCDCGEGYVRNPNELECLKIATELNGPCKDNIQCTKYSGIGSECRANKCVCKKGFYFDEDFYRCVRSCLCDGFKQEMDEMKSIMKEMAPVLKIMAEKNYLNMSLLSKLNNII